MKQWYALYVSLYSYSYVQVFANKVSSLISDIVHYKYRAIGADSGTSKHVNDMLLLTTYKKS